MFSFHKPKIYRSSFGCCICRAKSSSSRFTNSDKYEDTFEKCFRVKEGSRVGDICNACVLLVKRWKKLPSGTQRDWSHVVDARAGPGTKSLKGKGHLHGSSRSSKNKDKYEDETDSISRTSTPDSCSSDEDDDHDVDMDHEERDADRTSVSVSATKSSYSGSKLTGHSVDRKATSSSSSSQASKGNLTFKSSSGRKAAVKRLSKEKLRLLNELSITSYLDKTFWKMEKICCGIIFKGPDNELLVCPQLLKPCACRLNPATGGGVRSEVDSTGSSSAKGFSSSSPRSSTSSHPQLDTASQSSESADDTIKNLLIDDCEEDEEEEEEEEDKPLILDMADSLSTVNSTISISTC